MAWSELYNSTPPDLLELPTTKRTNRIYLFFGGKRFMDYDLEAPEWGPFRSRYFTVGNLNDDEMMERSHHLSIPW